MAEPNVRIEPGGHLVIDAATWVSLRTGGTEPALATDLHAWASQHGDDILDNRSEPAGSRPDPDWTDIATAWCQDRGHQLRGPGVIAHAETRLDAQVWVLLADTADGRRLAVVGINHDPPAVYLDTTGDPWWWYDANSVVIACPGGHSWRWQSGREVLTADGRPTTLTTVFGPSLDAPFTICPDCTAFYQGRSMAPCGCDRSPWIVCPTCGQRCSLNLPHP